MSYLNKWLYNNTQFYTPGLSVGPGQSNAFQYNWPAIKFTFMFIIYFSIEVIFSGDDVMDLFMYVYLSVF